MSNASLQQHDNTIILGANEAFEVSWNLWRLSLLFIHTHRLVDDPKWGPM